MHESHNETEFGSLEEFHNYVTTDNNLIWDTHLPDRLKRLGEIIENKDIKGRCQYELNLFSFVVENGNVTSKVKNFDGSEYPTFDLFDDDLLYLIERANLEENSKYKAYYNHLLWKSPSKHGSYAKTSIDHYILFLTGSIVYSNDTLANHAYSKYFKNLFTLSQEIGYRKKDVLEMLSKILVSTDINAYEKCSMMEYVVENGKQIEKTIYQLFHEYVEDVLEKEVDTNLQSDSLHLQILISQKLKQSSSIYYEKLGELQLKEAARHQGSFVVHDFYLKAILFYRKAGNKQKVEEVSVMLEKAKKLINLPKIEFGGNNEELESLYQIWMGYYEKLTDELMKRPPESIYTFLITHEIFPKAETFGKVMSTVTLDSINTMSFDLNKNISKKKKGMGLSPYHLHVQNTSSDILRMIFFKGIDCGKVSYETLSQYLKHHSWYHEESPDNDVNESFNWLELILPSLEHFFKNVKLDIAQENTTPENYILAVDSLVLKFEGLTREFSRRIDAQTIEFDDNETKERISFEKLLDNPKLQAVIPADDIAIFKYLFTSEGINLRNNIAHCFYSIRKYNPAQMIFMITAILRLGNYKLHNTNINTQ